jgi:hypothetical protein
VARTVSDLFRRTSLRAGWCRAISAHGTEERHQPAQTGSSAWVFLFFGAWLVSTTLVSTATAPG